MQKSAFLLCYFDRLDPNRGPDTYPAGPGTRGVIVVHMIARLVDILHREFTFLKMHEEREHLAYSDPYTVAASPEQR
jgi:hypothetical protein